MNKVEYKITTIPEKIIIDENAVYEFEILPINKILTIDEYEDNPTLKLVPIEKVDRLNNIIDELEKNLIKVRQITFDKYNSNEWNNCLSFNDDIKPILDKLKELKGGKEDEKDI